jgi:Prokaryotic lipoprotein-attachment site
VISGRGGIRFAMAPVRRIFIVTAVGLLLATSLAACGRRGEPQPPDGAPITYPRPYPRA